MRQLPMLQVGVAFARVHLIPQPLQCATLVCVFVSHPAAPVQSAKGEVQELSCSALPLGSMEGAEYRDYTFELDPGEMLLFLSDGWPEQTDDAGEPLGYARLESELKAVADRDPAGVIDRLREVLEECTKGQAPADDVTLLALRRV